jgi:2-polyprenyl-6-methoxyphenol hydroxylase-like FAD-dependent oxidoreductase
MVEEHDVVVVGAGPVGQTVAALLADHGVDVAVYERFSEPYGRPRAIRFDHEAMRMWQALSLAEELSEDAVAVERYEWFGDDGAPIMSFTFPEGPSGWPVSYVFYQPHLEGALDRALQRRAVPVHRGATLVGLTQSDTAVQLDFAQAGLPGAPDSGQTRRVRARYVIGADGARSTVRELLGVEMEDFGFRERWLVIDVEPNDATPDLPAVPQQFCDTRRPHMWSPNGRRHRRWEFMLLPGEQAEDFADPSRVWAMLEPWIVPSQGTIVRHTVYEFESRIAASLRVGRCLLAGDGAHVMAPHLGEGMCSGLRDANALAWRLALVLEDRAGDQLLDSYGAERLPHVRALLEQSLAMGRVSCTLDPALAAARDAAMREAPAEAPHPFPALGRGLVYEGPDGIGGLVGRLSVQGPVRGTDTSGTDTSGRLDDVLDAGRFRLLCADSDAGQYLSEAVVAELAELGGQTVILGQDVEDLDGALTGWLRGTGAAAVLIRPDFYVYGAVASAEAVPSLVAELLGSLGAPDRASTSRR